MLRADGAAACGGPRARDVQLADQPVRRPGQPAGAMGARRQVAVPCHDHAACPGVEGLAGEQVDDEVVGAPGPGVVELDAGRDPAAARLTLGRVPVERDHDPQAGRPPAREAGQQPGDAAIVASAADGMQQVVAVHQEQLESVLVPGAAHQPGRLRVATIAACSFSSTWMVSSIVARSRSPACRNCSAGVKPPATSSSMSPTTRAGTAPSTATRLLGMGAPADLERILTSARGTALALAHLPSPPRRTLVFGGPGLARELGGCRPGDRPVHAGGPGAGSGCRGCGRRLRPHPRAPLRGRGCRAPGRLLRGHEPGPRLSGPGTADGRRRRHGGGARRGLRPAARPRHRQAGAGPPA